MRQKGTFDKGIITPSCDYENIVLSRKPQPLTFLDKDGMLYMLKVMSVRTHVIIKDTTNPDIPDIRGWVTNSELRSKNIANICWDIVNLPHE